jgi:selenocysteine lyase/cysteine desulfurase
MLSDSQLANIRAQFPIFRRAVYLNSCSQGALSESSEAMLRDFVGSWHQYGSPWEMWVEQYETCRREFAAMIGAEADEVAVVPSVSAGVSSVATAFDFRKRSGVVMGAFEFPTMGHVWLAQQPRGARVRFIEPEQDRIPAAAYQRAITDDTLIVPVTGVCFMNGVRSQVREIVAIAHARGSYVLLDDYQDCGTRPRNMRELDVDIYAAGTLKYLLGASGLAFLYVKKELIPTLQPLVSGWFAQQNPFAFATKTFEPSPTARRFESGTPPIPNVYFALAGIRLLREIGLDNVEEHVRRLTQLLIRGALERGFQVKAPADSVGPLVVLKARDAAALVTILAKEDIICSSRHDGLRISFHVYNTPEDVTLVLHALDKHRDLLASAARPVGVNG